MILRCPAFVGGRVGARREQEPQRAQGLRRFLVNRDVGERRGIGVAVEIHRHAHAVRKRRPERSFEAVVMNADRSFQREDGGADGVQSTEDRAQSPLLHRIHRQQNREDVQGKRAEEILRRRGNAHRAEEQRLQAKRDQQDQRHTLAGSRRVRSPRAASNPYPGERIDEHRADLREDMEPHGRTETSERREIIRTTQQSSAEQRRQRGGEVRGAVGITLLHRAAESRAELPGELHEIETVQQKHDRTRHAERAAIAPERRAIVPAQPAEKRAGEGQRLRVNREHQHARDHAQAQRPRAPGAQEIGEARERQRAHWHGETRIPQHALVGDDMRRREHPGDQPSGQVEAARQPEQRSAGHTRAKQRAQHDEGEWIVRDEQQQLIDLRGQRPVANAEIPVQSAHRDLMIVIGVPCGGDQPRLVQQPRNIAWPKGDEQQRQHEPPRRPGIAAERA